MKYLIFFFLSLFVQTTSAQIKVAVLDTGLNMENIIKENIKLCEPEHVLTNLQPDYILHGSNVVSIIAQEADSANYCFVVYKIFDGTKLNTAAYHTALALISKRDDIDIVNLSLTGIGEDLIESDLIKRLLQAEITVVASAGNSGLNLGVECDTYPACIDSRIIVVGNTGVKSSNYGSPVDFFENGYKRSGGGATLTGTSQAAATFTGKLVRKLDLKLKEIKK